MKPGTVTVLTLSGLLGVGSLLTADTQAVRAAGSGKLRFGAEFQAGEAARSDSLVEDSKRAIIATGISPAYFEAHFKLIKTVNEAADRRVEWSFSVNEYQAQLVDAIGFHTTSGKRANVHGIKNQLYSTREIVKTLPRRQARKILRSCIGKFEGEAVTYRALTVPGKARLYLTGRSIPESKSEPIEAEREQEGRIFFVGFVDVETGKCIKKLGTVSP